MRKIDFMTIILDNVSKSYGNTVALKNFRVEIEWGKCYAFVGPKGSGKSTILKLFMGTETPDKGSVARMGDYKYPTLHSAYVSDEGSLNPKKDAITNVRKAHRFIGKAGAMEKLSLFLDKERMTIPVSQLTDVERRFVEIVRASFMFADFVVLDEPFKGMNQEERKAAIDYILDFRGSRPLLITAEEDDDLDFCNKIIHLSR